ncbi:MAG: hypothetical protein ACTSVI_13155 [Promethearchaeota archaeon]
MKYVHGSWCRIRSFPTTCKNCGAKVLYWECTHGSKVFFEFDKYGRLLGKHKCPKSGKKPSKKKYAGTIDDQDFNMSSISKKLVERLFKEVFQCPVCQARFSSESQFHNHFKQKKDYDDDHAEFYNKNKMQIEKLLDAKVHQDQESNIPSVVNKIAKPEKVSVIPSSDNAINQFGRLTIKQKGKTNRVKNYKDWYEMWQNFSKD